MHTSISQWAHRSSTGVVAMLTYIHFRSWESQTRCTYVYIDLSNMVVYLHYCKLWGASFGEGAVSVVLGLTLRGIACSRVVNSCTKKINPWRKFFSPSCCRCSPGELDRIAPLRRLGRKHQKLGQHAGEERTRKGGWISRRYSERNCDVLVRVWLRKISKYIGHRYLFCQTVIRPVELDSPSVL